MAEEKHKMRLSAHQEGDKTVIVAALRSMGNSYIAGSADKVLLDTGYSVCAALDQGIGVNELVDYLVNQFVSDGVTDNKFYEAVGLIIGASATFLCPQYSNLV